ncbi:MAG TPA: cytochrome c oxidase assembly protein [Rhodanobacter sp.]|nr:cytochrome c oxidase assembly protein [Rhodanobacter sp.]
MSQAVAVSNSCRGFARTEVIDTLAVLAASVLLYWTCQTFPADLPFWAPWDFSWVEFLGAAFVSLWYLRGLAQMPPAERPRPWRRVVFIAGLLLIYAVLQTHFEYVAQHMFFLNRVQHVAMHHLGPFLIAIAWPAPPIWRGMPEPLRRVLMSWPIGRFMAVMQRPVLAVVIFVGSFFFWLIPSVHFRAMLDPQLYAVMNWTMVGDGLLFWCLVLDPRPSPPARVRPFARAIMGAVVMFPQIAGGAYIAFNRHDLYSYYDLCGRLFPSVSPLYDQMLGGIIMWIPPAMMSAISIILVLNMVRLNDENDERMRPKVQEADDGRRRIRINASAWTGR